MLENFPPQAEKLFLFLCYAVWPADLAAFIYNSSILGYFSSYISIRQSVELKARPATVSILLSSFGILSLKFIICNDGSSKH